jgi:hypothetical protein
VLSNNDISKHYKTYDIARTLRILSMALDMSNGSHMCGTQGMSACIAQRPTQHDTARHRLD